MKKVGRNEPCPCGSGKKHKKCCGKEKKVIELFPGDLTKEEAMEVRRMLMTVISDRNHQLFEQLHEIFPLSEIPEKNLESAEGLAFEWFAIDYPFEGEESFFDYFLRELKGEADPRLLKKLESWKKSYLSVYSVESQPEKDKILLEDIFTKEKKELSVLRFDNIPKVNDLLVTRLVPVDGMYEHFFGALGIDSFSKRTLIDLLALDKEAENKTWERFLRENGEQLVDNILEMYLKGDLEHRSFDQEEEEKYIAFNFVIRGFLTEPQPVLQGKSPLEALYTPGMKKKIGEFLQAIELGEYDDEEQYFIKFSAYLDEIKDLLTTDVKEINDLLNLHWEKTMYKKEGELFFRKTYGRYFPEDIAKALSVWYEYCEKEEPNIRKTGAWASALDHLIGNVFLYKNPLNQKEVAEKYQVSNGTIARNMEKLNIYFANNLKEDREDTFDALDVEDRCALTEKIRGVNEVLLDGFHTWLMDQGLTEKTIRTHSSNIDFFINDYLAHYDFVEAREGIDRVSEFLGDWFIRKAMWSTKTTILSNITSIKKFYRYLLEIGEIEKEDFNRLKNIIKEEKDIWIETVEVYNDF